MLFYKLDDREQYKPGYKFAEWELKGVPLRVELGPRDCDNHEVVVARRDTGEKQTLPMDGLRENLEKMLEEMQQGMFETAQARMRDRTFTVDNYDDYKAQIGAGGFFRVYLDHANPAVEEQLQAETRSTIRCIPFDEAEEEGPCMLTGKMCKQRVLAAQAY